MMVKVMGTVMGGFGSEMWVGAGMGYTADGDTSTLVRMMGTGEGW